MRRRDFMKGLGALSVAFGFGAGRTVSAEVDRLGDEVIQEGADRGLYSQELADEIINFSSPEGDVTLESDDEFVSESELRLEPPDFCGSSEVRGCSSKRENEAGIAQLVHGMDWSKELDRLLEKDFHVHRLPMMRSGDVFSRRVQPELCLKMHEKTFLQLKTQVEQHQLDLMYCSFTIRDCEEASLGLEHTYRLFFLPAMYEFTKHLHAECEGKELYAAELPLNPSDSAFGLVQASHKGGRIPIRVTAQYDVCQAGTRVMLEFLAKFVDEHPSTRYR